MCEGVTMSIKYGPLLGAKPLDRCLEEAEASGILNLSGRNLRNVSCCEDYDISDVTEADFSRNRFTEIPSELCACSSLESLVCHHNAIKTIPDKVGQLKQLTHLDCSRNQLFSIPSSLCLLDLETLILRNNRLALLPPEVGSLKRLLELDVSNNELRQLPPSVGEMKRLRTLKLRRNNLTELPDSLCQLKLVHIDVTCNLLRTLPISLTRLTTSLATLELDSNPLESPPSEVCARGLSHILRYLLRKADDQLRPQRSNSSRRARTLDRISRRQLDTIPQSSTLNSARHSVSLTAELEHAKQKIAQKHGLDLWKSPDGHLPPKLDRIFSTEATLGGPSPVTCVSQTPQPVTVQVSVPGSTTSQPEVVPTLPPRAPKTNAQTVQPESTATTVSETSQSAKVVPTMSGSPKSAKMSSPTPRVRSHGTVQQESKPKLPNGGWRAPKPDKKEHPVLEQPSSSNDKKPLSISDKKPPSSSDKKPPSSSDKKQPSSSDKKQPSVSDKKPPSISDKKPPSISDKKPPSVSDKKPPSISDKKSPPVSEKKPIQHQDSSTTQRMSATQMAKSLQRKATSKSSPTRRESPSWPDLSKRRSVPSAATDGPIGSVQKEKESNGKGGLRMLKEQERIKNKQIKRTALSKANSAEAAEREKSRESERRAMAARIAWEDREKATLSEQPSVTQQNFDATIPRASTSSLKHKPSDPGPQRPANLIKSQPKIPRSKATSFKGAQGKFTVKRTEQNVYDHIQRVENMRRTIEMHLDVELPDDILTSLSDGVVLCNFLNHIRPQTVTMVQSPGSGLNLSQVKAQKNINSFLEGCKKLGVPSKMLCSPADILQHRDPNRLCQTVDSLVGLIDRETEI